MRIDLEQQRKRAKDLRRAHASGDTDAAARIAQHLPRARNLSAPAVLALKITLTEAQLVIAREAGFDSWPRLKHALDTRPLAHAVDDALAGKPIANVVADSTELAAVLGDDERLFELLDPKLADRRVGKHDWTPLLYACCARYGHDDPNIVAARVRIASRLLDLGADVNARGRAPGYGGEQVHGFEVEVWSPLEGAAGRVASVELMQLLLERGADVAQTSQLLELAVWSNDLHVLETALAAKPPWWQVTWALVACADLNRAEQARMLVPRAESPRVLEPALLRALREERSSELIEILLGAPTPSEQRRAVEAAVYRAARRYERADVAALLESRGADPAQPVDTDPYLLSWAIAKGHLDRVPALLTYDPNLHDPDGELPLHHAVRARSIETVDLLLAAGADINARNFDGRPAIAIADAELTNHLIARGARAVIDIDDEAALFERAADAVAFGDIETLHAILDDEPELVRARSPRAHRCTLLHYCGANGTEAPRQRTPANAHLVAELLLERGADPNATCKLYGGGSTTLGLMLTSVHPMTARLDGELTRVLLKYGARITDGDVAIAVQHGLRDSLQAFVDAGVTITLWIAAALDRIDTMAALVAAGTDVNARFADGYTALHAAAGMGNHAAVTWLLAHGAHRMLVETRWGGTAADKAEHFGHAQLAALLR
jgi:ankyrin repeat protein